MKPATLANTEPCACGIGIVHDGEECCRECRERIVRQANSWEKLPAVSELRVVNWKKVRK